METFNLRFVNHRAVLCLIVALRTPRTLREIPRNVREVRNESTSALGSSALWNEWRGSKKCQQNRPRNDTKQRENKAAKPFLKSDE
jgi:hypothetical protein